MGRIKLTGIELYHYKLNQKLKAEDNRDRRKGKQIIKGRRRLQTFI